ncbi:tetratricopeptide repeat protein [bacterium]|nr:tetratricopeptide repeat protein [bacterium]
MLKPSKDPGSPFFNLLADADEVQIREIPKQQPGQVSANLEKVVRDFEQDDTGAHRTFFVQIKSPPPPTPKTVTSPTDKIPQGDAELLQQSAGLLLQNTDYVLARNIFSYLLKQNLRDSRALRGLGICLYKLGQVVSSRKCFRALVELYNSEEAHYWLGLSYVHENQDAQAISHFEKVTHPEAFTADERFDLFKHFGNCLTRQGQLDRALTCYTKALELSPTSDTIHVNLGTLFIQKRDWIQAAGRFARALELNPKSGRAACGLAMTYLGRGDKDKARPLFHTALDLDSQNSVALHQLLEITADPKEFPLLKARLRAFLEKDPSSADANCALAALLFKEGHWKPCEGHVRRALELNPNNPQAQKLQADLNQLVRQQTF